MIACERGADVGDMKGRTTRRAVGTRDRVMSHLAAVGEVRDENGMASKLLAGAVGYPGSSIAFAQLLSGMERSGLIQREVRGKRTYRIVPAGTARRARPAQAGPGARAGSPVRAARPPHEVPAGAGGDNGRAGSGTRAEEFDYDELARRLLIQVVQRLAAPPADGPLEAAAGGSEPASTAPGDRPLEETVASLERKLARVQIKQRTLSEENARLREQLHEAQRSLALMQEQASRPRITDQLDTAEEVLLERLLSLAQGKRGRGEEAGTG